MKPYCFAITSEDTGKETSFSIPSRWEICDRCRGNGVHDNPAFANGISAEDFAEDEDFRENYFAGHYDVRCEECNGTGKTLVPDETNLNAEQVAALAAHREELSEAARDARADAYTRRMESGGY